MNTVILEEEKDPSTQAAKQIAAMFPQSRFCGFRITQKTDGKIAKIPVSKSGDGVSRDQAKLGEDLLTAQELLDGAKPLAQFWGVVLQEPVRLVMGDEVLCILDLDAKNSDLPPCVQFKRLIELSKQKGLMYEASHSGKGAHIIFSAPADSTLPKKINIGNGQEIEIFGHPSSGGKSVMLTGTKLRGNPDVIADVRELLAEAGIDINQQAELSTTKYEPKPLKRKNSPSEQYALAREALEYVNPDLHYDDWVKIGMALVDEFGADGETLWLEWSMTGNTWDKANINKAKTFRGTGVGLGSLFYLAKSAGWERPSRTQIERTTAKQDFAEFITKVEEAKEDLAIAASIHEDLTWKPLTFTLDKLKPINYLIEGFLAESFMVLAGQPGAGKTTAIVPIALAALGFDVGCLNTLTPRKVIYVSEDPEQVRRILYSFVRFQGLDAKRIEQNFVLIEAKRVNAAVLSKLRENVLLETVDGVRPLLVLDTASATMQLKDENDNAGVADFVACLKEDIYLGLKAPVIVITHTAKALSRNDEDASARGASAWEGDATLTATLFIDGDDRYIKLRKTRYEPMYREIKLVTHRESIAVADGEYMQDMNLTFVVPQESEEGERKAQKAAAAEDAKNTKRQNVIDACHTGFLQYVSTIKNPVVRVGRKNFKQPENTQSVSLKDWLDGCGIDGTHDSNERPRIVKAVLKMLGADNFEGWFSLKVQV